MDPSWLRDVKMRRSYLIFLALLIGPFAAGRNSVAPSITNVLPLLPGPSSSNPVGTLLVKISGGCGPPKVRCRVLSAPVRTQVPPSEESSGHASSSSSSAGAGEASSTQSSEGASAQSASTAEAKPGTEASSHSSSGSEAGSGSTAGSSQGGSEASASSQSGARESETATGSAGGQSAPEPGSRG